MLTKTTFLKLPFGMFSLILLFILLGWAVFIGVGAEYAAIARLGSEKCTATGAQIERHSSINRHFLHLFDIAFRAADSRYQVRHRIITLQTSWFEKILLYNLRCYLRP